MAANDIIVPRENAQGQYEELVLPDATTQARGLLSSTDKTKLDGIAAGAEVNVNADWNAASGDAQILNKPTSLTPTAHAASHAAGIKAQYNDQVAGMTENVLIRANTAGTAGNSITLSFDGNDDIDTVLGAWNSANPSNQATLISGDGSQVPDDGEEIALSGGVAAGSDPITNATFDSVTVSGQFSFQNGDYISGTDGTGNFLQLRNGQYYQIAFLNDGTGDGGESGEWRVGNYVPEGILDFWNSILQSVLRLYDGTKGEEPSVVSFYPFKIRDSESEFFAKFNGDNNLTDNRTYDLPDASGTLALTSDIPANTIASTIVDAKGDLIVGTAADTVARLPVGATNGHVLTVDSAEAGGMKWAAASGGDTVSIEPSASDILSVASGAISADDAGADRIVFWDDSASKLAYLEAGSGLTISGTTISVAGGGATNLWIPASAWIPRTTGGCGVDSREIGATNRANVDELLFDTGTEEFAQALVVMPSNYNNSTLTARFYWTAASGSGGVAWGLSGRAYGDDDALDQASGTRIAVTDTFITANDVHVTAATSAVTIDGTPAANKAINFEISRVVGDAADDLGVDARLLGVEIIFN